METAAWIAFATLAVSILGFLISMVRKITRLETEIENGVLQRLTIIDTALQTQAYQVAELHGWMRAMSSSNPDRDLRG